MKTTSSQILIFQWNMHSWSFGMTQWTQRHRTLKEELMSGARRMEWMRSFEDEKDFTRWTSESSLRLAKDCVFTANGGANNRHLTPSRIQTSSEKVGKPSHRKGGGVQKTKISGNLPAFLPSLKNKHIRQLIWNWASFLSNEETILDNSDNSKAWGGGSGVCYRNC